MAASHDFDLIRQLLVKLDWAIDNGPDGDEGDKEIDDIVGEIQRLSPDPDVVDYIFKQDLGVDQIIEKIRSYKPICL
jgi:hypothetical protein